ncbi:hypothetical protein Bbelb_350500 [Branchiostoma belcheri]|nr:hypothetical protein Bbelb_350500 [Branchiostoma belcheri]
MQRLEAQENAHRTEGVRETLEQATLRHASLHEGSHMLGHGGMVLRALGSDIDKRVGAKFAKVVKTASLGTTVSQRGRHLPLRNSSPRRGSPRCSEAGAMRVKHMATFRNIVHIVEVHCGAEEGGDGLLNLIPDTTLGDSQSDKRWCKGEQPEWNKLEPGVAEAGSLTQFKTGLARTSLLH